MLTLADLEAALSDERHLGWGYATSRVLPRSRREPLDRAVIAVANQLGLDAETLFHWTNSKHGRWLVDLVYGRDLPPTQETVRRYLNYASVAASIPEEAYRWYR